MGLVGGLKFGERTRIALNPYVKAVPGDDFDRAVLDKRVLVLA